jgi:hypothetical protein
MNRRIKYLVFLMCLLIVVPLRGYSQLFKADNTHREDSDFHYMILPGSFRPLETRTSFSLLFTQLPFDWVETSVEVPLFQLNNKLGLPGGFTLESSFQSLVVSNQLRSGLHWNFVLRKFSFSAGIDAAFLFGKMKIAGFNNKTSGWCTYPVLSAGYKADKISFTILAEYSYINSLKITSGTSEILDSRNHESGPTISFFAEQPLWKNHIMILGVINNFQKFYFPAWPAFSSFDKRFYIPQFYVGLIL